MRWTGVCPGRKHHRGMAAGLLAGGALAVLAGCAGEPTGDLLREAAAAAGSSQWGLALDLTETALDRNSTNTEALILHGLALHQLRQPDDALQSFENAAARAPDHFGAQYFHGWALCEAGRFADALTPLQRAYGIDPDHPDLLILLSRCCLEQNLKKGFTYLQALRDHRAYGQSPEVHNSLAVLWLGQGEPEKAAQYLQVALEKAPRAPVVLQNLAVLYEQYLNDPHQARKYYRSCLSESQKVGDRQRETNALRRLQQIFRSLREDD